MSSASSYMQSHSQDFTQGGDGLFTTADTAVEVDFADTTNPSNSGVAEPQAYSGPVSYLHWQYLWAGNDSVNLTSFTPNIFLRGGPGNDALNVDSGAFGGNNVMDGGTGSNFLVGQKDQPGAGPDTFFTDARGNAVVWNTLVNFHAGDAATLWGFDPSISSWRWDGVSGADGYTGATLRADVHGTGATDASITFAGISMAQAQGLQISTGTVGGLGYLYFHNPGV